MLRASEGYLAERGVDAPRLSAELLIAHVLGVRRLELYLAHDRPFGEEERDRLRPLIGRRGKHEPIPYLLGTCEWFDLDLEVGPAVLVPRPETEHLVELAIEHAPEGARCADIGTGSGAIAIAVAARRPDVTVCATDVSAEALVVAGRNVERCGVGDRVTLFEGRDWQPLRGQGPFDVLLSNPPYVDPGRPDLLDDDVASHEPHVALFAEPGDPASAYRSLVAGLDAHLRPGAWVFMETGVGAAEQALEVLRGADCLEAVELRPDLASIPRYLVARRRPGA